MSTLHPHWHSTNDEDGFSAKSEHSESAHVRIVPASRLPAALVGIVVTTVIGITVVGAWKPLLAQVGGSGTPSSVTIATGSTASLAAVEIRITKEGFSPASVVVKPGQKITWINDQSIPHILTSQTLRNQSGSYLNTPAIFPKGKGSFTVGSQEADREHSYGSSTDKKLGGTIVVSQAGQASVAENSTDPCKTPNGGTGTFGGLDDINLPTGRGTTGDCPPSSSSVAAVSSAPTVVIAPVSSSSAPAIVTNAPGTIDQFGGFNAAPDPLFPDGTSFDTFGDSPDFGAPPPVANVGAPVIAQNNYAPAAPAPLAQPDTGPGVWIVTMLSVVVLVYVTRRYFRKLA